MELEAFILAEVANFEKIRQKYEQSRQKKEKSFTGKIEKIIEEPNARLEKYPAIKLHPKAWPEATRMYGAINMLYSEYLPVLWIVIRRTELRAVLTKLEDAVSFLGCPRGNRPAPRVEDHALLLARPGLAEIDIERDKNEYLKECAFVLQDMLLFCDAELEHREPDMDEPLNFAALNINEIRRKKVCVRFKGATGYGAVLIMREQAQQILADFRLTAIRRSR
jgi:hypothetical protein